MVLWLVVGHGRVEDVLDRDDRDDVRGPDLRLTLVTALLCRLLAGTTLPAELPAELDDDEDTEDGGEGGDGDGDDEGGGWLLVSLNLLTLLGDQEVSPLIISVSANVSRRYLGLTINNVLMILIRSGIITNGLGDGGGGGGCGGGGDSGRGGGCYSGDWSEGGTEILQPRRYEVSPGASFSPHTHTPEVDLQVLLHQRTVSGLEEVL